MRSQATGDQNDARHPQPEAATHVETIAVVVLSSLANHSRHIEK
jgi:hypothetical protein